MVCQLRRLEKRGGGSRFCLSAQVIISLQSSRKRKLTRLRKVGSAIKSRRRLFQAGNVGTRGEWRTICTATKFRPSESEYGRLGVEAEDSQDRTRYYRTETFDLSNEFGTGRNKIVHSHEWPWY